MSLLDMSLDDIAKLNAANKPKARPQKAEGKKSGAGPVRKSAARKPRSESKPYERPSSNSNEKWTHDKFDGECNNCGKAGHKKSECRQPGGGAYKGGASSSSGSSKSVESGGKIHIANLNWEVTQDNLKELFSEVGEVRKAVIKYDRTGRSEGTAEVSFATRGAAEAAVREFNGALLDGMALKISVVSSSSSSSSSSSEKFDGECNNCGRKGHKKSECRQPGGGAHKEKSASSSSSSSSAEKFDGECNNCGRKGHKKSECRQPGGGAHKEKSAAPAKEKKPAAAKKEKPAKKESKTQAELDAEMDSYFGAAAAPADE